MIEMPSYDFYKTQCVSMDNFISPLKVHGVNYFSFARIYNDGRVIFFCNHQDWLSFKIQNKLFDYRGFIPNEVEEEILNSYSYHLYTGFQYKDNRVLNSLFESNRWNSVDLYDREAQYINILHLSGTRGNTSIINYYVNNMQILQWYFKYFQMQFEEAINSALKYKHYVQMEPMCNDSNVKNLINPDLFKINDYQVIQEEKVMNLISSFKKMIFRINKHEVPVSNREHVCMYLLTRGKSSKEIARILNLSYRTVEFYINNVKIKTGCHYKSELINLFYQHFNY